MWGSGGAFDRGFPVFWCVSAAASLFSSIAAVVDCSRALLWRGRGFGENLVGIFVFAPGGFECALLLNAAVSRDHSRGFGRGGMWDVLAGDFFWYLLII